MKKIIIFLLILFLGMQSTQVHSLQKAKGALLVGLSLYCYKKLLPSLFSWVNHPGKLCSKKQELIENENGSAQWRVHCTNNEDQLYEIIIPLTQKNDQHWWGYAWDYAKYGISCLINNYVVYGTFIKGLPACTIEITPKNNCYTIKFLVDSTRAIAQCTTSKNYIVDEKNILIKKISSIDRFSWLTHVSGLGAHNICNWACIGVGIYGGIKLTGIT